LLYRTNFLNQGNKKAHVSSDFSFVIIRKN